MPETFPGDRLRWHLRHGVGVDYDPAVANCLPSPFAARRVKALKFKVPGGVATDIGGLFPAFIIGLIGYHPDTRISLYVGFAWIVVLLDWLDV
ncbi:proline-specific permease [Escherichia coli]|uniref:Proline-specific permease n=1 Tax=Escherichia coli TaxID=562 RepID=A0A376P175_ECOLX|nr:proline-specific permease [Escherichia coli]